MLEQILHNIGGYKTYIKLGRGDSLILHLHLSTIHCLCLCDIFCQGIHLKHVWYGHFSVKKHITWLSYSPTALHRECRTETEENFFQKFVNESMRLKQRSRDVKMRVCVRWRLNFVRVGEPRAWHHERGSGVVPLSLEHHAAAWNLMLTPWLITRSMHRVTHSTFTKLVSMHLFTVTTHTHTHYHYLSSAQWALKMDAALQRMLLGDKSDQCLIKVDSEKEKRNAC